MVLQNLFFISFLLFFSWFFIAARSSDPVQLTIDHDQVLINNGILQLTLSNPGGDVTGIKYGGIENLVEQHNQEQSGGFWDMNWKEAGTPGTRGKLDRIQGTSIEVIVQNEDQVELSFTRKWVPSKLGKQAPLRVDKRFVVLRGCSGFYSYAIFEHLEDMPAFDLDTTRIAFMLSDKFEYMAVANNRQRIMPSPEDRAPGRGKTLAYPEAVLLVNPLEKQFQGEVDDKYQYSIENKDNRVHGWISAYPPVGFWQITPSNEFRTGGPFKQDLTSHVGPATLAIFVTSHYAGEDLIVRFGAGEVWKKVFGPVFIYLNSVPENNTSFSVWEDAKEQMKIQTQSWPYDFPASVDFLHSNQRGNVSGRLFVQDRYISKQQIPASGAYVGLAPPGAAGSWQRECKGYQFWTRTDENGYFIIKSARPGDYNLYASVPGFIGDYRHNVSINITEGSVVDVGDIVYEPLRHGPTLWEIGIPDRSAAEFYVPDPNPIYINRLYVNQPDRFRQYGLWERYAELYPDEDLAYTIGKSDHTKDWFFAQVNRKIGDNAYNGTTWRIHFELANVSQSGTYKLRVALASAHNAQLQVRVNDAEASVPLFSSDVIGSDNAIARHGIHGIYWLFTVDVPSTRLVQGNNTIFLTQASHTSPFQGVMYDYIRFEGPPTSASQIGREAGVFGTVSSMISF